MGYERYPNPKYDDQCWLSRWSRSCIDGKGINDEDGIHQEVTSSGAHSGRVYSELIQMFVLAKAMNKIMARVPMLSVRVGHGARLALRI